MNFYFRVYCICFLKGDIVIFLKIYVSFEKSFFIIFVSFLLFIFLFRGIKGNKFFI